MTPEELQAALLEHADGDLEMSREERSVMLCQTKRGNVTLHHRVDDIYAITGTKIVDAKSELFETWEIAGTSAQIRKALADLYLVKYED